MNKRRSMVMLLCLALSWPAAGQVVGTDTAESISGPYNSSITPENAEQYYQHARQLAAETDYEAALSIYRALLVFSPENADYLLGLGQVLIWSEQADKAIPYLEHGVEIAPAYEDLYLALFQAYRATDKTEHATAIRQTAAGKFNNPDWTQQLNSRESYPAYTLLLENQIEDPSIDTSNWRYTSLTVTRDLSRRKYLGARAQNIEKFDLTDYAFGIMGSIPLSDRATISASIDYSPDHKVIA